MLQRPCESERSGHAFAEMSTIINPPMPNLHALEVFAGIGGNSYAFEAAEIKTIGYCEIDPWAQAVLRSNMLRGRRHRAPIFPDVATFRCNLLSLLQNYVLIPSFENAGDGISTTLAATL